MSKKVRTVRADPGALAKAFADKYAQAQGRDLGAVELGIEDIYGSVLKLYGEILPRIARLQAPTPDDLLVETVDLWLELEHIQYHTRLAIRGIRGIERVLRPAAAANEARELNREDRQRVERDDELAAAAGGAT